MDVAELKVALKLEAAPAGLSRPVLALWHLARGDWEEAHKQAQDDKGTDGAWVHAHLHRVEAANRRVLQCLEVGFGEEVEDAAEDVAGEVDLGQADGRDIDILGHADRG